MCKQFESVEELVTIISDIEVLARDLPVSTRIYNPLRVLDNVFYVSAIQPVRVEEDGSIVQCCSVEELTLIDYILKDKGYKTLVTATSVYVTKK